MIKGKKEHLNIHNSGIVMENPYETIIPPINIFGKNFHTFYVKYKETKLLYGNSQLCKKYMYKERLEKNTKKVL